MKNKLFAAFMFTTALSTAIAYASEPVADTGLATPNLAAASTFSNTTHPVTLDTDGTTLLNNPEVLTAANKAQALEIALQQEKAQSSLLNKLRANFEQLEKDYEALDTIKDEANDKISALEQQLLLAESAVAEKAKLELRVTKLTQEKEELTARLSTAAADFIAAEKIKGMELLKASDYVAKTILEEAIAEWQAKYDTATAALTADSDIANLINVFSTIASNPKYGSLQTTARDAVREALETLTKGVSSIDSITGSGDDTDTPHLSESAELSVDQARTLIKSAGRSHVNATARMRTAQELNAYIKENSLV